jgi:hypothetical protein
MQTDQPYQSSPIAEVSSTPDSIIKGPPKEYRAEGSYFGGKTTGIMDMPTPYNMHGDEKKRNSVALQPNPHRRYSRKWFGHAYDAAVRVGKWPRLAYTAVGIILVGVWIGVMYALSALYAVQADLPSGLPLPSMRSSSRQRI